MVQPNRLTLSDILCIDEVYTNVNPKEKYAVVLLDFHTNQPIDMVKSRRIDVLHSYLLKIPLEERKKVKHLISDMHGPYLELSDSYFPNSKVIIDSFHIISRLNKEIIKYLAPIKTRLRKRINELSEIKPLSKSDKKELARLNYRLNLIHRNSWVLLKKRSKLKYHHELRYSMYLGQTVNTEIIINLFYQVDRNFEKISMMKELYHSFNDKDHSSLSNAREELEELI